MSENAEQKKDKESVDHNTENDAAEPSMDATGTQEPDRKSSSLSTGEFREKGGPGASQKVVGPDKEPKIGMPGDIKEVTETEDISTDRTIVLQIDGQGTVKKCEIPVGELKTEMQQMSDVENGVQYALSNRGDHYLVIHPEYSKYKDLSALVERMDQGETVNEGELRDILGDLLNWNEGIREKVNQGRNQDVSSGSLNDFKSSQINRVEPSKRYTPHPPKTPPPPKRSAGVKMK